jgi:hypothetical protein
LASAPGAERGRQGGRSRRGNAEAGFFVYYERPEDLLKTGAYENARDQDAVIEAGTFVELQVGGQADANALIDSLAAANLELTG